MQKTLLMLISLACLTGCATQQKLTTASGHPEITIRAPKKVVIDRIANHYSSAGYQIKSVNDYTLVVEKPSDSAMAAALYGPRSYRVTLSFSEQSGNTHVQARVEWVSNSGTGHEDLTDVSYGAADVQNDLEKLKADLEPAVTQK